LLKIQLKIWAKNPLTIQKYKTLYFHSNYYNKTGEATVEGDGTFFSRERTFVDEMTVGHAIL